LSPMTSGGSTLFRLTQSHHPSRCLPGQVRSYRTVQTGRRGLVPDGVGSTDIILPDPIRCLRQCLPEQVRSYRIVQTGRRGLVPDDFGWVDIISPDPIRCLRQCLPGQVRSYRICAKPVGGDLDIQGLAPALRIKNPGSPPDSPLAASHHHSCASCTRRAGSVPGSVSG